MKFTDNKLSVCNKLNSIENIVIIEFILNIILYYFYFNEY